MNRASFTKKVVRQHNVSRGHSLAFAHADPSHWRDWVHPDLNTVLYKLMYGGHVDANEWKTMTPSNVTTTVELGYWVAYISIAIFTSYSFSI